jgi:uncharacterized membrane protein
MPQDPFRISKGNDKKRWGGNPFAAPGTEVDEIREAEENALLPEPNRLAAGAGITWIREGWELMQGYMGVWIGMGVVWFIILVVLQLVPFLGPIAQVLLTPVFTAGMMLACRARERDEDVRFTHLFAGFSNRMGALMLLGLIYFLIVMFVVMIMGFIIALSVSAVKLSNIATSGIGPLWWVFLLGALFFIPLILAQWLSPQLVALHEDLAAWEAFKLAMRGVLRNLLPFTVLGIAFFGLNILALIPLGLGLLLLIPLSFCIFYAAYRDIFIRPH